MLCCYTTFYMLLMLHCPRRVCFIASIAVCKSSPLGVAEKCMLLTAVGQNRDITPPPVLKGNQLLLYSCVFSRGQTHDSVNKAEYFVVIDYEQ